MKKFIALTLCTALITNIGLPVYAADVSVTSEVITATAPSSFVADESQVGGGATVKLPATIDLTYDEAYAAFQYKGNIYCAGSIADGNSVAIEVPETIKYTGTDTATELDAFVKLGGKSLCCFSNDDLVSNTGKELLVQIPGATVGAADEFTSTVNFKISLAPMGMYTDIGDVMAVSEYETKQLNNGTEFRLKDNAIPYLSLRNLSSLTSQYYKYPFFNVQYDVSKPNVKAIEMSPDIVSYNSYFTDGTIQYGTGTSGMSGKKLEEAPQTVTPKVSDILSYNLRTWIMGCDNLSTLIIPNNIQKPELHCTIARFTVTSSNNYIRAYFNYQNYNLLDKGTPVGDAIMFVKGIDSGNNWIYVPNIVYRGTMSEWKALSANGEDWVFGNAANIVTVHCTDGKLFY